MIDGSADRAFFDDFENFFERQQASIAAGPVLPSISVTSDEVRDWLASRYDFAQPLNLAEVISDVQRMLQTWQVQVTHPRYFGLFNPSVTLASAIADTLVAVYNPQLAAWRTAPGANEIERHTLAWLAGKFGLPPDAAATFTSGGTEANLSAVVVALTRAYPGYAEAGLRSLPGAPTIYATSEAHSGFIRIAHLTGLGRQSLRLVAVDAHLRMDLADLERRVAEDRKQGLAPLMVVNTCGTTAAGVIDPLPEAARFCQEQALWFHVDAAWGGAAAISPHMRHYLAGIEAADSITCDAHKWFSVPMGAGMFFCRDADAVAGAFRTEAAFMPGKTAGSVFDPYSMSVQWSRRFIGLKLFLALANQGEAGYVEMIDHQVRIGNVLRQLLKETGWRILNTTPLPLVCFTREGLDVGAFLASLHERQIAWMSQVRIAGVPAIRACVTSFRTSESDVAWVVEQMNQLVGRAA
jgi:glutamate/tyrosine decarboxylase-like PLP-dependent enzyme